MARTKRTIDPKLRIIKAFINTPELEQCKMPKETPLSYRTIIRTLKPMETDGLIKLIRIEPSKKGGKEKKIYALTFKGALTYLNSINPRLSDYLVKDQIVFSQEKINEIMVKSFQPITPDEIIVFLENIGEQNDMPILKQINWLMEHYGLNVLRAIVFAAIEATDKDRLPRLSLIEKTMLNEGERTENARSTIKDFQSMESYFLREAFTEAFAYKLSSIEGNGDLKNDILQKIFANLVSNIEQKNQTALALLKCLVQTLK